MKAHFKSWLLTILCMTMYDLYGSIPNSIVGTIRPMLSGPDAVAITPDGLTAYICNYTDSFVSIVDTATNTIVGKVTDLENPTFDGPVNIVLYGSIAYVVNQTGNSVSIIDLDTNEVVGLVDLNSFTFDYPTGIAIVDDGKAYVTNQSGNKVSILDLLTPQAAFISGEVDPDGFDFYGPLGIAVEGNYAYIANNNNAGANVVLVDITTDTAVHSFSTESFSGPCYIAIVGDYAFITCSNTGKVAISDISTPLSAVVDGFVADPDFTFNSPQSIIAIDLNTVYVANYNGSGVSVVDISTPASAVVLGTIEFLQGAAPYGMAVTPDQNTVYVCDYGTSLVNVINVETHEVAVNIGDAGFSQMYAIAFSPDNTLAYVANYNNAQVTVIDAVNDLILGYVADPEWTFDSPIGVAFAPDGTFAYVVNYNGGVSIVDVATHTVTGTVLDTGSSFYEPYFVAFSVDGTYAYVGNDNEDYLTIINVAAQEVVGEVTVGSSPIWITVHDTTMYVLNSSDNTISVLDISNPASPVVTDTIGDGGLLDNPYSMVVTQDGTKGFVVNDDGSAVIIVDLGSNEVVGTVEDPYSSLDETYWIAMTPNGIAAYVPNYNSNTVSIVETAGNRIVGVITDSSFAEPFPLAIAPNGAKGYVCDYETNILSVMYIQTPVQAPLKFVGKAVNNKFPGMTELVNILGWTAPLTGPEVVSYQITRTPGFISSGSNGVVTVQAIGVLEYKDTEVQKNTTYVYEIVSVDNSGATSAPKTTSVTTNS